MLLLPSLTLRYTDKLCIVNATLTDGRDPGAPLTPRSIMSEPRGNLGEPANILHGGQQSANSLLEYIVSMYLALR